MVPLPMTTVSSAAQILSCIPRNRLVLSGAPAEVRAASEDTLLLAAGIIVSGFGKPGVHFLSCKGKIRIICQGP